jgi:hypothetical protein
VLKSHILRKLVLEMRNLEQAGAGLEKLVANSLREATDAALLAWPLACGSAVAERTRALDSTNGVLRVEVADLGWKSELQTLAPRYLAVLNRYTKEQVCRIEFVIVRPGAAGHVAE